MNTNQTNTPDEQKESRRLFLKQTGKKALWAAPVVTVIVSASRLRASPACTSANPCEVVD